MRKLARGIEIENYCSHSGILYPGVVAKHEKVGINWPAVREDGLPFLDCLMAASANSELVREFDRLTGSNLSFKGAAIEVAIDAASGRLDAELKRFCEFVWNCIFLRTPRIG